MVISIDNFKQFSIELYEKCLRYIHNPHTKTDRAEYSSYNSKYGMLIGQTHTMGNYFFQLKLRFKLQIKQFRLTAILRHLKYYD